jgi:DNA-binding MarR family transcriptional regulator
MARPSPEGDSEVAISPAAVAEVCFCLNLRRVTRTVSRAYDQALRPTGLKASQFNVLVVVASVTPATVPAVAGALAMDRTTLLRNLGPLKAAGYLQTTPGSGRRPDEIGLTVAGQNALTAAIRAWQRTQRHLTQQLGGSIAAQLLQGLSRIAG